MTGEQSERATERDVFGQYRPLDLEVTSNLADGGTVDVGGTEVFFKQDPHVPTLVEIYISDEEQPIGAINLARSETVTLGGKEEFISGDLREALDALTGVLGNLEALEKRTNPPKAGDSQ